MVTQITAINLIPRAITPRVNISQYDTGLRVLKFKVYNDNVPFTFTSGMTVALVGTKPDGKGFSYTGTVENNLPTFDVTEQMSAVAGDVISELRVYQSGKQIGSGNFIIFVKKGALSNDTDMSESDYAIINDAIEAAFDLDHFSADVQGIVTEAVENIQVKEGQTVIDPTLSVSGAAADAKATGDMARHFLDALMAETVGGAIATCDDAAGGLPLKRLVANIEPTQSGTGDPSPDNVRAISGYDSLTVARTGANIVSPEFVFAPMTLPEDRTVTFSCKETVGSANRPTIYFYNKNKEQVTYFTILSNQRSRTVTFPEGMEVAFVRLGQSTITDQYGGGEYMLNYGSTEIPYEPYTGATYPVTFPSAAGTVYGGTLTVNSDGSGTLTVDRVGFDAKTKTWGFGGDGLYAYTNLSGTALLSGYPTVQSSHFPFRAQGGTADGFCSWGGSPNSNGNLVVRSKAIAPSLADWNTYIQNNTVTFVYPLATPTTYALSAVQVATMLQGVNNIWTDAAGTGQAEYYANTALYVDKKIAELQALILENQ